MLTDEQWQLVEPLLPPPPSPGGRGRPALDRRLILDGILWKLSRRRSWAAIPFPSVSSQVCYHHYRRWLASGVLPRVVSALMQDLIDRGRFDPAQAIAEKVVVPVQVNGRMVIYMLGTLAGSWQAEMSMLYFQYIASTVEMSLGLSSNPDAIVPLFDVEYDPPAEQLPAGQLDTF